MLPTEVKYPGVTHGCYILAVLLTVCSPGVLPTVCSPGVLPTGVSLAVLPTGVSLAVLPTVIRQRVLPTVSRQRVLPTGVHPAVLPTGCTSSGVTHGQRVPRCAPRAESTQVCTTGSREAVPMCTMRSREVVPGCYIPHPTLGAVLDHGAEGHTPHPGNTRCVPACWCTPLHRLASECRCPGLCSPVYPGWRALGLSSG